MTLTSKYSPGNQKILNHDNAMGKKRWTPCPPKRSVTFDCWRLSGDMYMIVSSPSEVYTDYNGFCDSPLTDVDSPKSSSEWVTLMTVSIMV